MPGFNDSADILKLLNAMSKKIDGLSASLKPWLSVNEVADYLGLSISTIYQYVHRGIIPFKKIPGSRKLIFSKHDIDEWVGTGGNRQNIIQEAKATSEQIWQGVMDKHR